MLLWEPKLVFGHNDQFRGCLHGLPVSSEAAFTHATLIQSSMLKWVDMSGPFRLKRQHKLPQGCWYTTHKRGVQTVCTLPRNSKCLTRFWLNRKSSSTASSLGECKRYSINPTTSISHNLNHVVSNVCAHSRMSYHIPSPAILAPPTTPLRKILHA